MPNPYHDWLGRFTTKAGDRLGGSLPKNRVRPKLKVVPLGDGQRGVRAYSEQGQEIARLSWDQNGAVEWITVHPEYRRLGIGTDLFNRVKSTMEPRLKHSTVTTPLGELFQHGNKDHTSRTHTPPVDDAEDWPTAKVGLGAKWLGANWKQEWFAKEDAVMRRSSARSVLDFIEKGSRPADVRNNLEKIARELGPKALFSLKARADSGKLHPDVVAYLNKLVAAEALKQVAR